VYRRGRVSRNTFGHTPPRGFTMLSIRNYQRILWSPRCPSSRLLAFSSASRLSLQISWYRGLHTPQWPKGDYHPYFSIGLASDQCSGGCRRKYAAKFGVPFRPCAGKPIFYNIPREYLEFCIDFVRDYCIIQSSSTMELGRFTFFTYAIVPLFDGDYPTLRNW
jgi:hypothetical protein